MENISISNIVMQNIQREAIVFDLKYSKMPEEAVSERTPVIRNIHISNVIGTDVNIPVYIRGLGEAPISDISLTNVQIKSRQQPTFLNYERVKLNEVYINGEKQELK